MKRLGRLGRVQRGVPLVQVNLQRGSQVARWRAGPLWVTRREGGDTFKLPTVPITSQPGLKHARFIIMYNETIEPPPGPATLGLVAFLPLLFVALDDCLAMARPQGGQRRGPMPGRALAKPHSNTTRKKPDLNLICIFMMA